MVVTFKLLEKIFPCALASVICLYWITDAKKREIVDSASHLFRHAVLIDAIGNAAPDHSLDTIITHINAHHPLTIQHSALRALRHYRNEKV